MDEICFVIPGTNEIGAKLTQWITISDWLANLIVMDASAGAVLSPNTRLTYGFPRATAREIFASRNSTRNLYKCSQRMVFAAAVSRPLWAALILLCISTQLVECVHSSGRNEQMEHRYRLRTSMHTDIHEHCLLPWHCCMSYIQTASKTRAHLRYLWSVGSSCIYRCIVHTQKIMSWYEVGGMMIGSIKRWNKLCDIRIGQDRR